MNRRIFLKSTMGVLAAMSLTFASHAAEWPNGPLQLVVPFGAGGDTDFNARVLSKYLEPEIGVALPVVNMKGAGGTVAARHVKKQKPDGQTILFHHTTFLSSTAMGITDLSYEDFELVGIVAREDGNVIVVPAESPYQSIQELMEASKKQPGEIDLTANTGAMTYLIGSQLNNAGGEFNFVNVGGASGRLKAILGGNVDVSQNPVGQVKAYVDTGELKALATLSGERMQALPDVPTLKESGYPIELRVQYFFLFPKGTSKDIIEKFSTALQSVINDNKEYADEIWKAYYQKPHWVAPDEAAKQLAEVLANMKKVEL